MEIYWKSDKIKKEVESLARSDKRAAKRTIMRNKKNENIVQGWESPAAIHPGEFLKDDLEEYSISQIELAERTGISKKNINDIVMGKNSITRSTAIKLSKVFDMSFEYWINLQNIYENDKARLEEQEKINKEIELLLSSSKIKEMYEDLCQFNLVKKYRWVKTYYSKIILDLQKFFGVDSLSYIGENKFTFEPVFRKYNRENINKYSLSAWLRVGETKAIKTNVGEFDLKKLKDNLGTIKKLSKEAPEEYLPKIEKILSETGVVLVYAPYFRNTNVQGATQWIDVNKACIILKTTNQHEDKFWFNLFHEIGHIVLGHSRKEIFIDIKDGEELDQKEESEADNFAQKILIPRYKEIVEKLKSKSIAEVIKTMANEENISESIVAGRMAHEYPGIKEIWILRNQYMKNQINYINV